MHNDNGGDGGGGGLSSFMLPMQNDNRGGGAKRGWFAKLLLQSVRNVHTREASTCVLVTWLGDAVFVIPFASLCWEVLTVRVFDVVCGLSGVFCL